MDLQSGQADPDDLRARYESGLSLRALARMYESDVRSIRRAIVAQGGIIRRPRGQKTDGWRPRKSLPNEEIVARDVAGEAEQALATVYGCSAAAIRARLVAAGVAPRGRAEAARLRAARVAVDAAAGVAPRVGPAPRRRIHPP